MVVLSKEARLGEHHAATHQHDLEPRETYNSHQRSPACMWAIPTRRSRCARSPFPAPVFRGWISLIRSIVALPILEIFGFFALKSTRLVFRVLTNGS